MKKLRNLGLAFVALSFVELAWLAFCIFGGLLLGLVGFLDEELGMLMWAGSGAYAVLALVQAPVALLHLAAGLRLRSGNGGMLLTLAALASCLVQMVMALYCFPFELGVLIFGGIVLSDAEARKVLDGEG